MSRNLKITLSFVILLIGVILLSSEYLNSKKIAVYDHMNELYYKEEVDVLYIDEVNDEEIKEENNKEENSNDTSYKKEDKSIYVGYLLIPKIDFKKGFTEKNSKYNTVSRNVEILSSSSYPDEENGNVILAAHSGNSSVSFFKNLYKLNKEDSVFIEYNNEEYEYKITNIYEVEKVGKAEIIRKKGVSSITLITCTKNNKKTQTIYVGELINKRGFIYG